MLKYCSSDFIVQSSLENFRLSEVMICFNDVVVRAISQKIRKSPVKRDAKAAR